MALHDPVSVYIAETNLDAHAIRLALEAAGIEAHATEDVSVVGLWMFGTLPQVHKPEVWVSRADMMRAKPILEEFQRMQTERRTPNSAVSKDAVLILSICDECRGQSAFPAEQSGTIQDCPYCGEHMDVGDAHEFDDWGWEGEGEEDEMDNSEGKDA
jgi:hypothetical protein